MERRLAACGGFSAVCLPVDADHLSEKADQGKNTSVKVSLGATLKSALKDWNWQRQTLMRESQKANLNCVMFASTLRTARIMPSAAEASGKCPRSGVSVRAMVKPGAFKEGTMRHVPEY